MLSVSVLMSETAFFTLHFVPEGLGREMCIAAAIQTISGSQSAEHAYVH